MIFCQLKEIFEECYQSQVSRFCDNIPLRKIFLILSPVCNCIENIICSRWHTNNIFLSMKSRAGAKHRETFYDGFSAHLPSPSIKPIIMQPHENCHFCIFLPSVNCVTLLEKRPTNLLWSTCCLSIPSFQVIYRYGLTAQ